MERRYKKRLKYKMTPNSMITGMGAGMTIGIISLIAGILKVLTKSKK